MYRYLILFSLTFFSGFNVCSQDSDEQWETYFADFLGEVGAVTVDLSFNKKAPIQSHPVSIKMVIQLLETQPNGMPTEKELDLIYDIEEEVLVFSKQSLMEVGTIVTGGNHETYFYCNSALGLDSVISVIRERHSGRRMELLEAQDPEWNTYQFILFPPDLELLKINNSNQLNSLLDEEISSARVIRYTLRFKSAKMRSKFFNTITTSDFELLEERIDIGDLPYVITIGRKEPLIIESINVTTELLFFQAQALKGVFVGWNL